MGLDSHGSISAMLLLAGGVAATWAAIPRRRSFYQASRKTIDTADRLLAHYGSWEAVDQAATVGEDGVHRVALPTDPLKGPV